MINKNDFRVVVKERNNFESIQVQLLSRDNKEPVVDVTGLDFIKADKLIEDLVKEYDIHMDSLIDDYTLNDKEEVLNLHTYSIREYLQGE